VSPSPRRAVLDLAPLELDCMNTLWPLGEATVREIRDLLAERRPRAYTTIMTIMDRLARKGVVERRKSGRAYLYRANLSAEQARAQALGQVIDNFFAGSKAALLAHLDGHADAGAGERAARELPQARAAAAAASGHSAYPESADGGRRAAAPARPRASDAGAANVPTAPKEAQQASDSDAARIDATLL